MTRKMTENEKEYITEAVFGYLNGFNDCGESEYPKLTVNELAVYGYETIEFDGKHGDFTAKKIYFCGKDAIIEEAERIIREDSDFSEVCTDW